jgi:hypothetical protein
MNQLKTPFITTNKTNFLPGSTKKKAANQPPLSTPLHQVHLFILKFPSWFIQIINKPNQLRAIHPGAHAIFMPLCAYRSPAFPEICSSVNNTLVKPRIRITYYLYYMIRLLNMPRRMHLQPTLLYQL